MTPTPNPDKSTRHTPTAEDREKALRSKAMGRVVTDYIDALRDRTLVVDRSYLTRLKSKLARLEATPPADDVISMLEHASDIERTTKAIADVESRPDIAVLRDRFIAVAAEWAEIRGITPSAFASLGVPASVLRDANLTDRGAR